MQAQSQQINEYEDIQSWLEINIRASEPNPQFNASFVFDERSFLCLHRSWKTLFFCSEPPQIMYFYVFYLT